jgi:hypothetical protein
MWFLLFCLGRKEGIFKQSRAKSIDDISFWSKNEKISEIITFIHFHSFRFLLFFIFLNILLFTMCLLLSGLRRHVSTVTFLLRKKYKKILYFSPFSAFCSFCYSTLFQNKQQISSYNFTVYAWKLAAVHWKMSLGFFFRIVTFFTLSRSEKLS